jgi:DNA-directed RNA polymerase beta' subunit
VKGEYIEIRRTPDGKTIEINRPKIQELRNKIGKEEFEKTYKLIGRKGVYSSPEEAMTAHQHGWLDLQAEIKVRIVNYRNQGETKYVFTSVGRLIFANIFPKEEVDYIDLANEVMTKKALGAAVSVVHEATGNKVTARLLDSIKNNWASSSREARRLLDLRSTT